MATGKSPESSASFGKFIREFPQFDIELTRHARERMQENAVTLLDLRKVLQRGYLLLTEQNIRTGRDLYRVAGSDVDNQPLEVVTDLVTTGSGCAKIVTVIRPGRRKNN